MSPVSEGTVPRSRTEQFCPRRPTGPRMWTRDALLFAILLALLSIASRLPSPQSSQPLLAGAGILGAVVFAGRTLWAVAAVARAPE